MEETEFSQTIESRINKAIKEAHTKYKEIKEYSDFWSTYELYEELDELGRLIDHILYCKKQIARFLCSKNYPTYQPKPNSDEEHKLRHQQLLDGKKVLQEQRDIINKTIELIKEDKKLYRLTNMLEMSKLRLETELAQIESKLRIYEAKPDLSDGEIDIYIINQTPPAFRGVIYLHGTSTEVGVIDYRGPVDNEWLGDIGYTISEHHRGHNYAYKALELISKLISSQGIETVRITTYKDNIPSVKTIEKFGGELSDAIGNNVLSYTCSIKPILEQSQGIKK